MDYIEEILGEKVTRKPWMDISKFPLYIKGLYNIDHATIGKQACLLLMPQSDLGAISAVKKHLSRLKDEWLGPMALELPRLTRQRRQTLLAEKIPFVVPGKQLFLPFMGAVLQEKFDSETLPAAEKLQPSAQMLLFYFIYGKNRPLYLSRISEKFGFSAMTVTRATAQLTTTGFLSVHKDGVQKVLTSELTSQELYEKAKPLLFDPVRKRFYINSDELPNGYFIAGESALSLKSMLGEPNVDVFGTAKAEKFATQTTQLIDSDKQCQVGVWRYDPTVLSGEKCADALSLALSLRSIHDERVEITIDEMLEGVWG
ncbi:MAG: hypothetical protein LBJ12_04500 [Oscillospiraceae bacterium]|nr:hypothetical protein [Oscillospiraceae bacterium]